MAVDTFKRVWYVKKDGRVKQQTRVLTGGEAELHSLKSQAGLVFNMRDNMMRVTVKRVSDGKIFLKLSKANPAAKISVSSDLALVYD